MYVDAAKAKASTHTHSHTHTHAFTHTHMQTPKAWQPFLYQMQIIKFVNPPVWNLVCFGFLLFGLFSLSIWVLIVFLLYFVVVVNL